MPRKTAGALTHAAHNMHGRRGPQALGPQTRVLFRAPRFVLCASCRESPWVVLGERGPQPPRWRAE
eukprot:11006781-Alexandrium_andersonii.AAC.1